MTATRSREEMTLQIAVVTFLRTVLPHALVFSIPNEGRRSRLLGHAMKRMGLHPGAPDLIVMLPGRTVVGMELKGPKGKVTEAQEAFHEHWRSLGYPMAVVRSIEDARLTLQALGIQTREAA